MAFAAAARRASAIVRVWMDTQERIVGQRWIVPLDRRSGGLGEAVETVLKGERTRQAVGLFAPHVVSVDLLQLTAQLRVRSVRRGHSHPSWEGLPAII